MTCARACQTGASAKQVLDFSKLHISARKSGFSLASEACVDKLPWNQQNTRLQMEVARKGLAKLPLLWRGARESSYRGSTRRVVCLASDKTSALPPVKASIAWRSPLHSSTRTSTVFFCRTVPFPVLELGLLPSLVHPQTLGIPCAWVRPFPHRRPDFLLPTPVLLHFLFFPHLPSHGWEYFECFA